jgi:hypothetical protein
MTIYFGFCESNKKKCHRSRIRDATRGTTARTRIGPGGVASYGRSRITHVRIVASHVAAGQTESAPVVSRSNTTPVLRTTTT